MRSHRPGARALVSITLAALFVLSTAPTSTVIAVGPTDPGVTAPVPPTPTDPVPPTDATPVPDPTTVPDPTPVAKPAPARPTTTEAQHIIRIAKRQIGDPWRYGARGPRAFDCSGLVIYAFKQAGGTKAVARGRLASARALYQWYKARGLTSRSDPKIGDLVIWGRGTHVGIYIGNGKAISTLRGGVRIHRVRAVTAPFTAYLHTGMWKKASS